MDIISLGLGVQSTALYYQSSLGELPRAEYAVTADPGKERSKTYANLQYLLEWAERNNGIPIRVVKDRNLYTYILQTAALPVVPRIITRGKNKGKTTSGYEMPLPAYTEPVNGQEGMLRRQCTEKYKIIQVDQYIRREIYKLPPKKHMPPTRIWKGITLEEVERMSYSGASWKTVVYPFINYECTDKEVRRFTWGRMTSRNDLTRWYVSHNLPIPSKSACTFCPYTPNASWAQMKNDDPEDFMSAVLVDRAIRHWPGEKITKALYLHKSCKPLEEIDFDILEWDDLWSGECSGTCHL